VSTLVIFTPSSSNVSTYCTRKGDLTSFSLILLPLLSVSSLDTSFIMSHIFDNLSSYMILSGIDISPAHPSFIVYLLFILDITICSSPLSLFSSLLWSTFSLMGPFSLTSYHLLMDPFYWIHSVFQLFLFPLISTASLCGGFYFAILSGSMCIKTFSMNNILIQISISSNSFLLGSTTNFISTLLKDSLHPIETQ
jgi:hypothetical protein